MNPFNNKNVLITGGMGFIGSNLATSLSNFGAKITIVDSMHPAYGFNPHNIDSIADKKLLVISNNLQKYDEVEGLVARKDFIFSLAGQTSHLDSMSNPWLDIESNIISHVNILEACRKVNRNAKLVYTSTRQVYGKPNYLPVDEAHPFKPVDVNAINKYAAESYYILYKKLYGIQSSILRLTNTYGPHMRIKDSRQIFLGIWIRCLLEGKKIQIYGDGLQVRDFTYVDDCVNAIIASVEKFDTDDCIFNIGGESINLIDLAKLIIKIYGQGKFELIEFPANRASIDIGNYIANYRLASNILNWAPKITLEEGLSRTLFFYQNNILKYI
jgi:nucleoside-diphosphate-sugar epimerase